MLLQGNTLDLWALSLRDLINLVYAFVVTVTPESVSMQSLLEETPGTDNEGDEAVKDALSGDEPADVAAARAAGSHTLSIQEALAAGGLDLMAELRSQMEAGATSPLG